MAGHLFSQPVINAIYPMNQIIAILDELEDAQLAIEALQLAGFGEKDVLLVTSPQATETSSSREQRWRFFNRIRLAVSSVVSDESPYQELCMRAIRQGHHIVNVHALHEKEQQLAAAILKDHRGHTIKFFGWWAITDYL
jgi:hypothetical protein